MTSKELYKLTRKSNKTKDDWLVLFEAGLADYEENDSYILNEVGLAGGFDAYCRQMDAMRRQGIGPM